MSRRGPPADRITRSPDVLGGRAAIRGLRISVAHVVDLIANGLIPQQVDVKAEGITLALQWGRG